MRIGLNALLLNQSVGYRQTGISRYIDRLLRALPVALEEDNLLVYAGRGSEPPIEDLAGRWKRAPVRGERPESRILWEHLGLPAMARKDKLDLFHGPVNVVPPGLPCPSVVTIHDLALLRFPEQVTKRRYRYLSRTMSASARRVDRIITISEHTKQDIVELLHVEPEKIAVTPLGVDQRFRRLDPAALDQFRVQAGIERPFVLFVGTLEPRKNLPNLLNAFALIKNDVPHDLVVIGPEGWLTSGIHEAAERLQRSGRVQFRGFVPDGQLPAWYSACDLFAFPSLYEGFGLPALEAMACGAPVVTSTTSSLPEVVGDAAISVDPSNVEAIAGGMRRILTAPDLANELSDRGPERAKIFTWSRTAELTVKVYREAIQS